MMNKKNSLKYYFVIVSLISSVFTHGQCLVDGLTINNQSQIDNFSTDYPGCTKILGNVNVNFPALTSFSGLSQVDSIMGSFFASEDGGTNTFLGLEHLNYIGGDFRWGEAVSPVNFQGLNNLKEIGGDLDLEEFSFVSFDGLEGLERIGGSILLEDCYALESLNSITQIDSIFGDIIIECNGLSDISGFSNLVHVSGNFELSGTDSLNSLLNLANLHSVFGSFLLNDIPLLENLLGLENLTFIGEDLFLRRLNQLENIESLDNLTTILGQIRLWENNALFELEGLENVNASSLGGLEIWNNTQLSFCSLPNICSYLSLNFGPAIVEDNDGDCLSIEHIIGLCPTGLSEELEVDQIVSFPNPSDGLFQLSKALNQTFQVYDGQGRFLKSVESRNGVIRLNDMPKGFYVLFSGRMNPMKVLIQKD